MQPVQCLAKLVLMQYIDGLTYVLVEHIGTQVADRPRSIKAIEKNGNNINNSIYSHISRGKISENCSKAIAFSF